MLKRSFTLGLAWAVGEDGAYLSRKNRDFVEAIDAKPWFDVNFQLQSALRAWKRIYHRRWSAKTAFSDIKRKVGTSYLRLEKTSKERTNDQGSRLQP
jgi:hypothetical protein